MADRFPDYDVLDKRDTPSWNEQTRRAIDERLATPLSDVLTPVQRATLASLIDAIVPPPAGRPPTNALALVLAKVAKDESDGYRLAGLPRVAEAWSRGLDALEAEAHVAHERGFAQLDTHDREALLTRIERGETCADWAGLDARLFWQWRLIPDIVGAYFTHPSAWSAMGFGGPAGPRGYVRLQADRRDPWEAAERDDGALLPARVRNRHVG